MAAGGGTAENKEYLGNEDIDVAGPPSAIMSRKIRPKKAEGGKKLSAIFRKRSLRPKHLWWATLHFALNKGLHPGLRPLC